MRKPSGGTGIGTPLLVIRHDSVNALEDVLDGWFYSPIGMFLDYPFAFGVLGIAALFKKQPILGVVAGVAGRFVGHFISGVVFFGMYAPEGMNPIVYSAVYNGGYLFAELVISAVLIYALVQRNVLTMDL